MKNTFVIAAICALFMPLFPVRAEQAPDYNETVVLKPVVIIRFNKPNIDFQSQLSKVVQSAVSIKQEVMFDVIQYLPQHQSGNQVSNANLQSVVESIAANGIASDHIRVSIQSSPDVVTDEIYLFAR